MKSLYYGDNLEVLRNKIKPESIDLCYIDPPFNSKRNYFQIYNNIGNEDKAQAQAFVDTWEWEDHARTGYQEIMTNQGGRFTKQIIELIRGLRNVLGEGSLLSYLVSMTLRIAEIHRILKPTGSFYLHCDPTCSHYLKLILDGVFCPNGGDFRNEIVWCYAGGGVPKKDFGKKHDIIFRYTKSDSYKFNLESVRISYSEEILSRPKSSYLKSHRKNRIYEGYDLNPNGKHPEDWWQIQAINPMAKERLGYPTQKPEALLERIVKASSNKDDTVLDAYCGCGTTVAVAERLKRNWIGMDITYQSISLILKRLEDSFGKKILQEMQLDGIPQDIESAKALAAKKDDRLRKEFEKWAVLTYSNNRAAINMKKGADKGIDGTAYFPTTATSYDDIGKIVFQVKSGGVSRSHIATLRGDMEREKAEMAILITLDEPTKPMREEAKTAGTYEHKLMGRNYDRIQIVTVKEIVEEYKRLEMPVSPNFDVVKKAESKSSMEQITMS